MQTLIRVTLKGLCFGLVADETGKITQVPPVAKWCINKNAWDVVHYYRQRGATYELLPWSDTIIIPTMEDSFGSLASSIEIENEIKRRWKNK